MRSMVMGAALAAVMTCAGLVDGAKADQVLATVIYRGYADVVDPFGRIGGSATDSPFEAVFYETYNHTTVDGMEQFKLNRSYFEFIHNGTDYSPPQQFLYDRNNPVNGSTRSDISVCEDCLLSDPWPSPGQISYNGLGDSVGYSIGFTVNGLDLPSDPTTTFLYNFKSGGLPYSVFGGYEEKLAYNNGNQILYSTESVNVIDLDSIVVLQGVSEVPLPSTAPLFGAALLVLGGVTYRRRQASAVTIR